MKQLKSIFAIIILFAVATGCKKFEALEQDPNKPTTVTPGLLFNGVVNDMYRAPWSLTQRWSQFYACNYNYYGNQEYNWGGASLHFTTLKNVVKMEEEAARIGLAANNPYTALGKFFRAFFFYEMTMKVGDLPMNEALQGISNPTPKYDTQKDIFKQVLVWLDESNTQLTQLIGASDNNLTGDIFYNNKLSSWQKAVNAFKLRVLIQLSKKEGDADLAIRQKFAEVLNGGDSFPLFSGNADNMVYTFNPQFNKYPINPDNFGFDATRYNMTSTYLNTLAGLKDPRTFYVAEPAGSRLKAGLQPTDYAAFVGASPAQDLADMSSKAGTDNGAGFLPGEYSFFNRYRYYRTYTAEQTIQIGYPEMCFNIAEGIARGWAAGDAESWYQKGIQASHAFYGIQPGALTVYFFKAGGNPTNAGDYNVHNVNFDWNAYYAQPTVQYAGNNQAGIQQILVQKYLAFYQNSGWEPYFNWRRTGVPAFEQGGPGTGNSGTIPKRFQYPASENTTNNSNLTEALQRQFSGQDNINASMWVIN
jgi:hypothetical protein